MARIDPNMTPEQKAAFIAPRGTPVFPPGQNGISPGAYSVRPQPCAYECTQSPLAKSVGGVGGVQDVIEKGGQQ